MIKVGEHIPCAYSVSMIWAFHHNENNHDICIGEDFIKKILVSLWKHTMKIINFEKKKIILSTNNQQELYEKQKSAPFAKQRLKINVKNYGRVSDNCHYTGKYRGAHRSYII